MSDGASTITVVAAGDFDDGDPTGDVDLTRWQTLAKAALSTEQVHAGELNLLFVDEAAMAKLNSQYMGSSGPTDVLAFPIDGLDPAAYTAQSADGPPALLGDVVICPSVAAKNAAANGVSVNDELALLVVHGVLHVLGHDHAEPEETALMKSREQALLGAHHRP